MLLRHTPTDELPREHLTVNPAKTCQPIGAMYAALGIHRCLPHSHGSQGCCSYHRSQLTRHFKEPVVAATSSFTEGSSVFGGQANMLQAITNIFSIYEPDVIAVHTTCLSETIGDDLVQIARKAQDEGKIPEGKVVFHASTPSYQGSHVTGYSSMVKAMVDTFSETGGDQDDLIDLLPGWIEPADVRELKRLTAAMGIETITFPDTSGVLDTGLSGKGEMYGPGGTTIEELKRTGQAKAALGLGPAGAGAATRALETKCKVNGEVLELPYGLRATDRMIEQLRTMAGVEVPEEINYERSRLLDLMSDMEQYFHGKSVSMWGDPDQLVPLCEFLTDLGMVIKHVVTGTPGKAVRKRFEAVLGEDHGGAKVMVGNTADMYRLHTWIKQDKPDLLIGGTHGKYIARDEDIPLIRHGFPIMDRIGHQYFPTVAYKGAMRLCEQILDAIMDRQDRDAPEEKVELVM